MIDYYLTFIRVYVSPLYVYMPASLMHCWVVRKYGTTIILNDTTNVTVTERLLVLYIQVYTPLHGM